MKAHRRVPLRDVQPVGNLRVRALLDIPQDHYFPERRREMVDRRQQHTAKLGRVESCVR